MYITHPAHGSWAIIYMQLASAKRKVATALLHTRLLTEESWPVGSSCESASSDCRMPSRGCRTPIRQVGDVALQYRYKTPRSSIIVGYGLAVIHMKDIEGEMRW